MKKETSIFWGVTFICAALLLIVNAFGIGMGFLDVNGLPVFRIILGILCVAGLVMCFVKKKFYRIFIPIGFLFIIFEEELAVWIGQPGKDLYSFWLIALCVLLLTVGIMLLFPGQRKKAFEKSVVVGTGDQGPNSHSSSMSYRTLYIDCTDFVKEEIENNMGSFEVFFQNTEAYHGGGELNIENNMGSVVVHLPDTWRVETDMETNLAQTSVPDDLQTVGTTLRVTGENNLGSVKIIRDGK
ncbi:MAG: hypothetical protein KIG36_01935 [Eubacteriales bacterium]|nr:hypothetical protein [Eubacteriales bacterium]